MCIIKCDYPVIENGSDKMKYPYTHGLFTADGTYEKSKEELPLDIDDKYRVPINCNLDTKLRWLEGYLDGDGCVTRNKDTYSIQFSSIHKNFLKDVMLLLNTIGVDSRMNLLRKGGIKQMPDGRGGYKGYNCKDIYRVCISAYYVYKLVEIGFSPKRLKLNKHKPNRSAISYNRIKSVEKTSRYDDTYCFTEEKEGKGMLMELLRVNVRKL